MSLFSKSSKRNLQKNFYDMKKTIFILLAFFIFSNKIDAQIIDHWETIVFADDDWKYRIGNSEPPSDWYTTGFNDSSWSEDEGGFGYDDNDDNTVIAPTTSIYLRREFEIENIEHLEMAILNADFDDAFIAYLNGVEIARANIEGTFPAFDAPTITDREAQMYQGGEPLQYSLDKNKINQCMVTGDNVLAIQVQNVGINSSDMSAIFFFSAGINNSSTNYQPTPNWFFPPAAFISNLPILKINTFGQQIPDEPKIEAHLGIIDNGTGNNNNVLTDLFNGYDGQIAIETRGSSSQSFPKKNYGFETQNSSGENNNVELLGMPKENDWILHGPFSDKSLMRNVLAFHIGNEMGRWAPRTRFCELIINNDYRGVYVLMEKIKRDKDRVDIARLDSDDNAGDSLTGGYIVQVDREEFGNGWWSPFLPNPFIVYHHPNGFDMTFPQRNYIQNYITDFEGALLGPNFMDPNVGYSQYIDIGSFVDYLLAVETSKEVDAYRLSTFLFKDKDSNGGKLNAGPLWDFNLGFGNADYCESILTTGWAYDDPDCEPNQPLWWNRLLEDENFENQVKCRWQELRDGPLHTDSLMQFIDEQAALLSDAQVRNFNRWQILGNYVWPNAFVGNTFQEEINFLKSWTSDRLTWMDQNVGGVCEIIATNDLEKNIDLKIQPNPFSESIDFIFNTNNSLADLEIKIYDVLGKEIRVLNFSEQWKIQWDGKNSKGNEVVSGVYFYILSNKNNAIKSGRILKF